MKDLWNPTILVVTLALAASLLAERVVLTNGSELTAEILKSDEQTVVLDLGFSALSIPRDQVVAMSEPAKESGDQTPAANDADSPDWQLYQTFDLPWRTIAQNARQYGEGVVLVKTPNGQGSGFIINPQGYLITNYHVIARETRITIVVFSKTGTGFEQRHYKKTRIVAMNPFSDLALLKIEETDDEFQYVYLGNMSEIKTGDQVFAIGNPLGLTRTVSQGIVSTTNRNFEGQLYIQTTTDINPGNSGGPLFNLKGQVVGVTSMGYIYLGGLNFAIPVDVVKRFIENRDAYAYDEDNPNAGYRYLQPSSRSNHSTPPASVLPRLD